MTLPARRFDGKPTEQPASVNVHPNHRMCRVEDCSSRLDGSDGLCGYHRALRQGPEAVHA